MNIRGIRQEEAVQAWMDNGWGGVVNACCGMGKTRIGVNTMKAISAQKVLIAFPRHDIKQSWIDEFVEMDYSPPQVEWSTFASLKRVRGEYDLIILDEIHEASQAQLDEMGRLVDDSPLLGLTGTLTKKTENEILRSIGMNVCYSYPISKGVEEGIICDYEIYIHEVNLDNKRVIHTSKKGKRYTEKSRFDSFSYVMKGMSTSEKRFMELKLIQLLQGSQAKVDKVMELLSLYEKERVLVFCGLTEVADKLNIPVYHSNDKDEERFLSFCRGEVDKMATCRMVQAGINIKPIDRGIVNCLNGDPEALAQKLGRFLRMEYNNPEKKAKLHIISSREEFERVRIKTSLQFFEQSKIFYI